MIFKKGQNTTNLNATLVTIILYTFFTCREIHWHKHIYSLTITQLPFENLHNFTQKAAHIHFYINRTMVEIINQFISAHPVVNFCYFMVYERSKYPYATPVAINECSVNFYYLKLLMNCGYCFPCPRRQNHTIPPWI